MKASEFFSFIKRLVLMTGQDEHNVTDVQEQGDTPVERATDKEEESPGRYRLPRKRRTVKRHRAMFYKYSWYINQTKREDGQQ